MLWEARSKTFKCCTKWPSSIKHAMIDLQETDLGYDRGRHRVGVTHPPIEVTGIPADQDVADVEDDTINPPAPMAVSWRGWFHHSRVSIRPIIRRVPGSMEE